MSLSEKQQSNENEKKQSTGNNPPTKVSLPILENQCCAVCSNAFTNAHTAHETLQHSIEVLMDAQKKIRNDLESLRLESINQRKELSEYQEKHKKESSSCCPIF